MCIDGNVLFSTFWGALFGAICGFPFILWSNRITRRNAAKKLVEKMKKELMDNKVELEKIKDNPDVPVKFVSPIWEIVPTSNIILDMNDKVYSKIVDIYIAVRRLNELEESIKELDSETRKKIISKRTETLTVFDENMI